jgi:acetolactate synthase-1/2/3 large subunit
MASRDSWEGGLVNVAEYVFERIAEAGVKDVFMVSGGGCMYLVDALGRNDRLRYWCNHHEQASAIAAESNARVTGKLGVCLVTTGPGSTNALSAIAGAWVDSIPVLVVSGQVRTGLIADYARHRQIGPQEIDIVDMAAPVTKYAKTVMQAADVPQELERAIGLALSGRPGPVWLNIPLDIQSAELGDHIECPPHDNGAPAPASHDSDAVAAAVTMLAESRRPLVLCSNGIHLSHAEETLRTFLERLGTPMVTTIGGMDLLEDAHPLSMGRFGATGQRRANFALQNADLLLCIGASMSIASVGFDTSGFAPRAKKIVVNIEPAELEKPNLRIDLGIEMDARSFMQAVLSSPPTMAADPEWVRACQEWKERYPLVSSDHLTDTEHVNSYVFANSLSQVMGPGEVIVTGNGMDAASVFHSFAPKQGQRMLANANFGAMGWDLPAVVGACVARDNARTVLMTGDGSMELNVQELLTIGSNKLNVKIFVINNGGYESIRATQHNFFEGRFVGCEASSGVSNPDFEALARAYGLTYRRIGTNADISDALSEVMADDSPWLCELNVSFLQEKSPKIVSRRRPDGSFESCSLDDQYPFLPREEWQHVMGRFASE